eukprot:9990760-Alexandrium_andersonii.AAC.1
MEPNCRPVASAPSSPCCFALCPSRESVASPPPTPFVPSALTSSFPPALSGFTDIFWPHWRSSRLPSP